MADPSQQPTIPSRRWWHRLSRGIWKALRFFWLTIVIGLLLAIIGSLLFEHLWSVLDWINQHLLLTGLAFLGAVALTVLAWIGSSREVPRARRPARVSVAQRQQSRLNLVQSLRLEYTRQLEHSLQRATMIAPGLHERTDVTLSSAQFVFRRTAAAEEHDLPLPHGTSIVQAYDGAGQGLLILGEPGTGKTTLLLDLACTLLTRAEGDPMHPIPIILNLASWAMKKQPLADWLIDQARLVYGVPSGLSQAWLGQDQWLLLLDGLDEVEASARSACIEAVNVYRGEHLVPLVVCSRSHEYLSQRVQLALPTAVMVQPLQEQQVRDYLERAGKPVEAVRVVLNNNPTLRKLITTPLMLNVVILTYRDRAAKDLPHWGSAKEQQQQVFEHYIGRMLERPTTKHYFTPQQTRCWLTWLAQQMKHSQLTEFYLERLQPTWLATNQSRAIYTLLVKLASGLVCGLVLGLLGGLFGGLIGGLGGGLLGAKMIEAVSRPGEEGPKMLEIHLTEVLTWSWADFSLALIFFGLVFGLFGGLLLLSISLVTGQVGKLASTSPNGLVFLALLFGLFVGLAYGLAFGAPTEEIPEHLRVRPNQGIRSSGWHAVRIGLVSLLVGGSLIGFGIRLLGGLFSGLGNELGFGLLGGLFSGLYFGLIYGGGAYLEHYVLRFVLWRSGAMPWHYVRFLEEATERILLQRVGGGYRFIHPLFQDYFASLRTGPSASTQSSSLTPQS